ncbi:hypothetical protein LTR36_009680 [Oleoguttula mirabilis]|uniref:Tafazzin family protein n=1 Tax=Oleoguttula mirabilis TaxID=1507867 RepID=A0AAV9J5Y2_9PEZI|nr:hypothetical protein LTR36_009680 [Oleoguttula mirabilis]
MAPELRPYQPPLSWRIPSTLDFGVVAFLCRSFLYGLNNTEVHGLDRFLDVLDSRKDERARTRGLITVSNHVSVMDDPLVWGVLPFRYHWYPSNMRWSLGSFDICFKNSFSKAFFSYGNTLPTHRAAHSKYGGLFQPTITQVIRLLSDPHANTPSTDTAGSASRRPDAPTLPTSLPPSDPFSASQLTYTTTGTDTFPAPSAYPSRRFSWIHIFPEGMIHQHPDRVMRYFKWGVARLILEAEPCPDVLPIWIDGPQNVMSEKRTWPRFIPRAGKDVTVSFGELVDTEAVFGPFRVRWREMKEHARRKRLLSTSSSSASNEGSFAEPGKEELGELHDDDLRYGPEAEQLRIDVTLAVRNEVLKVRRACGLPDEDPKRGLAETFRSEGGEDGGEREVKRDGSVVRDG